MVNDITGTDIIEGMTAGRYAVPELGVSPGRRSKELQYWKMCEGCPAHPDRHGWVVLGPVMSPRTAIEYTEFMNSKHATPLPKYGQYIVGSVPGQKYNVTKSETRWDAILENEGIHEFPIDQMIAYNWHRFDVLKKVVPALKNVVDIRCEHGCSNRLFTQEMHYRKHISVMHQDVAQPEAIGKHFESALKALGPQKFDPEMITQIVAAVAMAMKAQDSKDTA